MSRYRPIRWLIIALLVAPMTICVLQFSSETKVTLDISRAGYRFVSEALDWAHTPRTPERQLFDEYIRSSSYAAPCYNVQLASAPSRPADDEPITLFFHNPTNHQSVKIRWDNGYEALDGWQFIINDDSISFDLWGPDGYRYSSMQVRLSGEYRTVQTLHFDTPWVYDGYAIGEYVTFPTNRGWPAPPTSNDNLA